MSRDTTAAAGEIPCAPLSNKITYQLDQFRKGGRGWYADASDLQWPPGMWPNRFKVAGLGNGQDFILMGEHGDKSEVQLKVYCQEFGCITIEVWND
jgi:hypothetical protein